MKIIVASHNHNKVKEFQAFMAGQDVDLVSLEAYPEVGEIEENGSSFEENAIIKAETVARLTGEYALSDDSGLVVPFLNNEPGIYSARYSGDHDDLANNEKLKAKLKGVKPADRKAYFVSVLALTSPEGETVTFEGRCPGLILEEERGEEGFGYDPLFYYEPSGLTFAEMSLEEKNKISHRALAFEQFNKKRVQLEGDKK